MPELRLLVDRRAGREVARRLPVLLDGLRDRQVPVSVVATRDPRAATRAALEEGCRYVVAGGGDRTVHDVVNGLADEGLLDQPAGDDVLFGVADLVGGCDFARNFGMDRPPGVVARHLAGDDFMPIDVGRVDCLGPDGQASSGVFANVAQVGYGADLERGAAQLRWLGRVGRLLAAWAAIRRVPDEPVSVEVRHTTATAPRLVDLVVANGQFITDGSKVAPRALPDDGLYNVQLFTGDRSQMFLMLTEVHRGEHLPHPQISEYQSPSARLAPTTRRPVEADGRWIGWTPATFTLHQRALRLKI